MTNDIYGSDSAVPSGLGLLFHHPTLERVGYSRASLREKGFRSVDRFDQCIAEKCPNSSPSPPLGERVPEGRVRGILRGSWSQCAVAEPWRLSMNLKVGRDSVEPWNSLGAMNIRARRSLALPTEISSWSRFASKFWRFSLPMKNLPRFLARFRWQWCFGLWLCAVLGAWPADSLVWPNAEGRVDAQIDSWNLTNLLQEIAASTGWQVYLESGTDYKVSAKFKGFPVGEALRHLLGNLNYALLPNEFRPPNYLSTEAPCKMPPN